MKRIKIIRLGAYGDHIILTPVLRQLKKEGWYIVYYTNSRGREIFKHSKLIDEFINHDESIPIYKVGDKFEEIEKAWDGERFINFTESIECNLALHPNDPAYIYSKDERRNLCNKNYYEATALWAGVNCDDFTPLVEFSDEEITKAKAYLKEGVFNILWCLSGSGKNKAYPWVDYVMGECMKKFDKRVNIITVGDERCQLLEDIAANLPQECLTMLAGKINIRESMALTGLVELVVSPDTGVLHASGCYITPKIGLLGHTTKENITKHFFNDLSIESKADCAPCFRLVYDYKNQCPVDPITKAAFCQARINPQEVFNQIEQVYNQWKTSV